MVYKNVLGSCFLVILLLIVAQGYESEAEEEETIITDIVITAEEDEEPIERIVIDNNSTEVVANENDTATTSALEAKVVNTVKVKVACWNERTMGKYQPRTPLDVNVQEGATEESNDTNVFTNSEDEVASEDYEENRIEEPLALPLSGGIQEINVEDEQESELKIEIGPTDANATEEELKNLEDKTVELVNGTYLTNDVLYQNNLIRSKSSPGNCTLVMFHAPWCPFSAKAAPHFNALPRAFPPLRVVAVDTQKYKSSSSYYGILAVPTIILFHNGKVIAKFNDSLLTITKFAEFIEYHTDLKHNEGMNVTAEDYEGPLPSVAEVNRDWFLLLSWIFLILTCTHYITKSIIWWRFVEFVRTTWREAELQAQPPQRHLQHEHLD